MKNAFRHTGVMFMVAVIVAAVGSSSLVAGLQEPRVGYSGPQKVAAGTTLRAFVTLPPQRVVGVTFRTKFVNVEPKFVSVTEILTIDVP